MSGSPQGASEAGTPAPDPLLTASTILSKNKPDMPLCLQTFPLPYALARPPACVLLTGLSSCTWNLLHGTTSPSPEAWAAVPSSERDCWPPGFRHRVLHGIVHTPASLYAVSSRRPGAPYSSAVQHPPWDLAHSRLSIKA